MQSLNVLIVQFIHTAGEVDVGLQVVAGQLDGFRGKLGLVVPDINF
jgi:hypothetical protein